MAYFGKILRIDSKYDRWLEDTIIVILRGHMPGLSLIVWEI